MRHADIEVIEPRFADAIDQALVEEPGAVGGQRLSRRRLCGDQFEDAREPRGPCWVRHR